jgi:hypothetical protein
MTPSSSSPSPSLSNDASMTTTSMGVAGAMASGDLATCTQTCACVFQISTFPKDSNPNFCQGLDSASMTSLQRSCALRANIFAKINGTKSETLYSSPGSQCKRHACACVHGELFPHSPPKKFRNELFTMCPLLPGDVSSKGVSLFGHILTRSVEIAWNDFLNIRVDAFPS